MYTMKMTRKAVATMTAMIKMNAMATTIMMLINQQKSNKNLGVERIVVLVVIWKK